MARKWTRLYFGKYKGKTLPWIIFHDPDYFFWACEEGVFENKDRLHEEAEELYRKSQSIKIPGDKSNKYVMEYTFSSRGGSFRVLEKVPRTQEIHARSTRREVIDFREVKGPYDKQAYKLFIPSVKYILFGDRSHKMTEKRCQSFFNKKDNFI